MKKSQLLQFILTLLFGPLGLFYSSVAAALAFLAATIITGTFTHGVGVFFLWPIVILAGFFTVSRHNKLVEIEEAKHHELVQATKEGAAK
ncbi:MAG: hypothetical protein U9Q71_10760 [Pseudomonadota bacterium]|nr:hypothetical protein [Pseudomonadota bacterium]